MYHNVIIHWLVDGNLGASCFGLAWIKFLWTLICKSLCRRVFSFPLGDYLGVEHLEVRGWKLYRKVSDSSPNMSNIYTPSRMFEKFCYSIFYPPPINANLFSFSFSFFFFFLQGENIRKQDLSIRHTHFSRNVIVSSTLSWQSKKTYVLTNHLIDIHYIFICNYLYSY